jgi:glutamine amidotransferase
MGNLGSVRRTLSELGVEPYIAEHPDALSAANRIILPGVGAFPEGMERLRHGGWVEVIHRLVHADNVPMLGICLGMQMLATFGEEGAGSAGLALIDGRVKRLDAFGCKLRIPHVGWNDVIVTANEPLFARIPQGSDFYFVHSYAFAAADQQDVIAVANYDVEMAAAVRRRHVFGTQFHPEKSSRAGRQLLRNFLEYAPC